MVETELETLEPVEDSNLNNTGLEEVEPDNNETSIDEREKQISEREKQIIERELKADLKEKLGNDFKHLLIMSNQELNQTIESFIDFSSSENFSDSYDKVMNLIRELKQAKSVPKSKGYNPTYSNNSVKQDPYDKAWNNPPKVY